MPVTIQLPDTPAGVCVANVLEEDAGTIRFREFISSEDGNEFITRLENIGSYFDRAIDQIGIPRCQIATLLAVVKPGNEAVVYVNEVHMVATIRRKRPHIAMEAGTPIYRDDIADFIEASLVDSEDRSITIGPDCGVTLIYSSGWRKGLFYDFSPLLPNVGPRRYNLERLFGHILSRLEFQHVHSISEIQWSNLTAWGWFPFIGLTERDRKSLLTWATEARKRVSVLEGFARRFQDDLDHRLRAWETSDLLKAHMPFVSRAKERLDAGDYLSCIGLLYPRIEGVMRSLFVEEIGEGSPTQDTMTANLVENQLAHSVLLPNRFEQFLMRVYFRAFDERSGLLPLSRHTVSHGVSRPEDHDLLTSIVGFLTLDQLFYYLSD